MCVADLDQRLMSDDIGLDDLMDINDADPEPPGESPEAASSPLLGLVFDLPSMVQGTASETDSNGSSDIVNENSKHRRHD